MLIYLESRADVTFELRKDEYRTDISSRYLTAIFTREIHVGRIIALEEETRKRIAIQLRTNESVRRREEGSSGKMRLRIPLCVA